ncbi:hypothetical protein A2U01_0007979 [Trifolium medium]|uniref:RNase H type-1 domain-containing protein n=1 Tax=Trifolium medium TaxID=97028 RepID=A0A392MLG1_9FABA|nr:hypothetical protein [Trifolium medium]
MAFDMWNTWFSVHILQRHVVPQATDQSESHLWVLASKIVRVIWWLYHAKAAGYTFCVEVEAWALLQAMKEARRRGLVRVQFESDLQALVEAIRTKNGGFF